MASATDTASKQFSSSTTFVQTINMNKKRIATAFFALALGLIIWWAAEGAAMFTSSEQQVKVKDELFGTETVNWEKNFTPGLELIGPLFGVFLIGGLWMMYSAKKDERTTQLR
jgi:hypothetical protein